MKKNTKWIQWKINEEQILGNLNWESWYLPFDKGIKRGFTNYLKFSATKISILIIHVILS